MRSGLWPGLAPARQVRRSIPRAGALRAGAWELRTVHKHRTSGTERAIRRSDVIFMYDNPERYEAYGCTVLGWAGHGGREHVAQAHAKGVDLYTYAVGFRTEFSRMIDFSPDFLDAACRDLSGEPFIVPWLWDHKHKGQPAWWFCANSPLYRAYLDSRLVQLADTDADGLHIDDYTGTAGTVTRGIGCFCPHCMAGFRAYLADRLVLSLINLRQVKPEGFVKTESGAVVMDDGTRKTVLVEYQKRKREEARHPFLQEKVSIGLLPHIQAMLLARFLRGDLDGYPPFFFR